MEKMSEEIVLNYHTYPLVVGNADKYTFSNWDMCGSTVLIEPKIIGENYTTNDINIQATIIYKLLPKGEPL